MKIATRNVKEIEGWIVNYFINELHLNKNSIDLNKSFTDYGISSLQAATFAGDLERWLERPIDPSLFFQVHSINEMTDLLSYPGTKQLSHQLPHKIKTIISSVIAKPHFDPSSNLETFKEIETMRRLKEEIDQVADMSLYFNINEGIANNLTKIEGKKYINFSSFNYLNLSGDKDVTRSVIKVIKKYGTSVSASRLVGGEKQLHRDLEETISHLIGTEACIVFNSGHATNVSCIGHLMNKKDLLLLDEYAHNSLQQGAKLSGATLLFYKHNDMRSLKHLLDQFRYHHEHAMIVTEGVFSMDGDIAPLPELIQLKKEYQALLYIDEAHSLGVIGKTGRGLSEYYDINPNEVDIWMGTLSKAFASCGGFIAAKRSLVDYLRYSAPGFVYSCGLTPGDTAAALAAIEKMIQEPSRVIRLQTNAKYFMSLLKDSHVDIGNCNTPIIPILTKDSHKTIRLCAALRKKGIYLQALFFPVVKEGMARLRIFINSSHTENQLKKSAEMISKAMQKLGILS